MTSGKFFVGHAIAAACVARRDPVQSLDDYYRTVELALIACLHQAGPVALGEGKRPPHERPHEGKIGAVVVGSDQGLVGRFNEVIVEFAVHELKTLPGSSSFPSDGRDLP
jgi:F-type H+-transporting ATPase subunit gamma